MRNQKIPKLLERMDWWLPEVGFVGWVGEMCEGCPKVQTSSYKIIKVEGCDVQHVDYS